MSGLVTQDWQLEFDGLLLGAGTPYQLTALIGFLDLGGVRAPMTQRARQHGGYVEAHYAAGATRTAEFNITATSAAAFQPAVATLRAQTYAQDAGTRPLWFQVPGQGLLTGQAQVLNRSIPTVQAFALGLVQKAAVQWYFPDPFWYGPTQTATTGLPSTSGGLVYPLAYPLAYGTTATGWASCQNIGSEATSPTFTVTGPHDNGFQVTSVEDGLTLQYNGPLGANDTVTINTATGSVVLNGVSDRRNLLTFAGVWPSIPAGATRTYAFSTLGATYPAAQLTVTWAPAYA